MPSVKPKKPSRCDFGSCAERLSPDQWRGQACPGCGFDGCDGSSGLVEADVDGLGIDTGFLSKADGLAERARSMRNDAVTASQQAAQRRSAALDSLVRDESATVAAVAGVWQETAPWCDAEPGQRPIAVDLAEKAANRIEGEVAVAIYANSAKLFALAQSKAKAVVAEVAALPPIPDPIFQSPDPAHDLARHKEHRGTWGVLVGAAQDLEACHAIGSLVADHLGYGPDNLEEGAPRPRPRVQELAAAAVRPALPAVEAGAPVAVRGPGGLATRSLDPGRREDFAGRSDVRRTVVNTGAAAGVI